MAKSTSPPFTQSISTAVATLNTANGAIQANAGTSPNNTVLFITGSSEGTIVKSISVSSNDTSARTVAFYISKDSGTTKYLLGTFIIPITAGLPGNVLNIAPLRALISPSSTTPMLVSLPMDQVGDNILMLAPGVQIYVGCTTTITASKNIYFVAQMEEF